MLYQQLLFVRTQMSLIVDCVNSTSSDLVGGGGSDRQSDTKASTRIKLLDMLKKQLKVFSSLLLQGHIDSKTD
jgi:hypothetical protein